jgi:hypothetical protein
MWLQWILRIAGYAFTAVAAPLATTQWGPLFGFGIGMVGGALLHMATPTVIPKRPIRIP